MTLRYKVTASARRCVFVTGSHARFGLAVGTHLTRPGRLTGGKANAVLQFASLVTPFEPSIMDMMQRFIALVMNCVRVNQLEHRTQDGCPVLLKRRRIGMSVVIWCANRFLALARSASRMFVHTSEWMNWELECARLLYPGSLAPKVSSRRCIVIPQVKGVSLRQMLERNEVDAKAFRLAARELRRVHQIPCGYYNAGWSHGDLHLDNILYDAGAERAVIVDFDTRHLSEASAADRHCDDLHVLLLELLASPGESWSEWAAAFIEEYRATAAVLRELNRRLFVPRGSARILFYARTYCSPMRQTEERLERLRGLIERVHSQIDLASGVRAGERFAQIA